MRQLQDFPHIWNLVFLKHFIKALHFLHPGWEVGEGNMFGIFKSLKHEDSINNCPMCIILLINATKTRILKSEFMDPSF